MTISLPKELEASLIEQARRLGMKTDAYVAELLARTLVPMTKINTVAKLFDQMRESQWTDDPAEISRRAGDEQEFMEAINRNRSEMEGPNARRIYP